MKRIILVILCSVVVLSAHSQQKFIDILNSIELVDRSIDISKIEVGVAIDEDFSQLDYDLEHGKTYILLGKNADYSIFACFDYLLKSNFTHSEYGDEEIHFPDKLQALSSVLFVDRRARRCFKLDYFVNAPQRDTKLTKVKDRYFLECRESVTKNISCIQELDIHDLSVLKMDCQLERWQMSSMSSATAGDFTRVTVYYTKNEAEYVKTFYLRPTTKGFPPNVNEILYIDLLRMYRKYKREKKGIKTVKMDIFPPVEKAK